MAGLTKNMSAGASCLEYAKFGVSCLDHETTCPRNCDNLPQT